MLPKDQLIGEDVLNHRRVIQLRRSIFAALSVLIVALVIAVRIALTQRNEAQDRRDDALRTQSLFLADSARQQVATGHVTRGQLLALEALPTDVTKPDRPYVAEAESALYETLQSYGELAILSGHRGPLTYAGFSPDGRYVVTASQDHTAALWNAESGARVAKLEGHKDTVWYAAFSQNSQQVITVSKDATAHLWDVQTAKKILVFKGHEEETYNVLLGQGGGDVTIKGGELVHAAFSPNGKLAITASMGGTARVWDTSTGVEIGVLRDHDGSVEFVSFSQNGRYILTLSKETVGIWDSSFLSKIAQLEVQNDNFLSADYSPDGKQIVTGSQDGSVRLWDADTGRQVAIYAGHRSDQQVLLNGHTISGRTFSRLSKGEVVHVGFSPDGAQISSSSISGTIRLLDRDGLELIDPLIGHQARVNEAIFSQSGHLLASASDDNDVRLWEIDRSHQSVPHKRTAQLALLSGHTDHVLNVDFSPDDQKVVTASMDGTARIWGQKISNRVLAGHKGEVRFVTFTADGFGLITLSVDGTARLWDVNKLKQTDVLQLSHDYEKVVRNGTFQYNESVIRGELSLDGLHLLTVFPDNPAHDIRIWNIERGKLVLSEKLHFSHEVSFDASSRYVVETAHGVVVRAWDLENGAKPNGKEKNTLLENTFSSQVDLAINDRPIAEALDGLQVIFSPDRTLKVTFAGDSMSLDGTLIFNDKGVPVGGTHDADASVWKVGTEKPIFTFKGHTGQILHAAFSPDGRRIATASSDGSARIWNAFTGALITILNTNNGPIWFVAFSPDGHKMAMGSSNGIINIFDVFPTTADIIDKAIESLPRATLTSEERTMFFLESKD